MVLLSEGSESMRIAALLLMALFYGCYFGKMFAQRARGIRTNQMAYGKKGRTYWIELLLKILTILTALCEVVSVLQGGAVFAAPIRIAGLFLTAVGTAFFWASVLTMRDSWRAGVPEQDETEFVSRGVFQISRNPAFLGFDLTYLGLLLVFFRWYLLVVSAAAVLLFHLQITLVEEPFLHQRFGEVYAAYCRSVRRYLGRK